MKPEITRWQHPPVDLTLNDGELHLWRFKLDSPQDELDHLSCFLSVDEVKRADRLLDTQKKKQYIVARAYLKQILGRYLIIEPDQIKFQYNAYGKPALADSFHSSVSFNLTHSGAWGALAVVNQLAVGVDLEKIEAEMLFSQLAERYFDASEKQLLAQYPPERQRRGFYRIWTQKEARLKLAGVGFQKNSLTGSYPNIKKSQIAVFPIAPGFLCSVATTGKQSSIQKFHFFVS